MRDMIKLAARLMIFALTAALLLALVNALTADRIDENTREKLNAARREVIGDYEFETAETDISGTAYITGVYRAVDGGECVGYVYELKSRGYGGSVFMCVGVGADGCVSGVKVSSHVETKGLGTADETGFLNGFYGMEARGGAALGVDAMSGATVSSNAVRNAVDEALSHYQANFSAGEAE